MIAIYISPIIAKRLNAAMSLIINPLCLYADFSGTRIVYQIFQAMSRVFLRSGNRIERSMSRFSNHDFPAKCNA
jgi:hypothetical protein